MLDCIILGSMDIGQEVTKQGFPLDLLDKLMVCEVNEPSGVFLGLEDLCWPIPILPFTNTLSSPGITYTFRHMCCQSRHFPLSNRLHYANSVHIPSACRTHLEGNPVLVTSCPMSMEPRMMQSSMLSTHTKQGCRSSAQALTTPHPETRSAPKPFSPTMENDASGSTYA